MLNATGIYSYQQLADARKATLVKILADAGSRFKMHDPSSWARQSKLAAKGDWNTLKALQDELNGGK